jgi:hypothetical protein
LVEGKLDTEVFGSLLAGQLTVEHAGSKGGLAPKARDRRKSNTLAKACYIRDRDFDHHPPTDVTQPTVDSSDGGAVLGWRWCRHEIDPDLVAAALQWDKAAFEAELVSVAKTLLHYESARWAAGQARRVMPPAKEFPSKPSDCSGDFRLPADLSETASVAWVRDQASAYLANAQAALTPQVIEAAVADHAAKLNLAIQAGVAGILIWYSGKDLLAGLTHWLQTTHRLHPTETRNRIRDWVAANPDQTLKLLPEWDGLRNLLRSYP